MGGSSSKSEVPQHPVYSKNWTIRVNGEYETGIKGTETYRRTQISWQIGAPFEPAEYGKRKVFGVSEFLRDLEARKVTRIFFSFIEGYGREWSRNKKFTAEEIKSIEPLSFAPFDEPVRGKGQPFKVHVVVRRILFFKDAEAEKAFEEYLANFLRHFYIAWGDLTEDTKGAWPNLKTMLPAEQIESALPAGWERYMSPEGMYYYYNTATQTTQWERPTQAAVGQIKGSPSRSKNVQFHF